jgi:uncharacterized membrane protein (DUF485 family)
MSAVLPPLPPSATRRSFAIALSIITLLCALLYWLVLAFITAQIHAGVYGGPELGIAATILMLPPAAICTIIALILVGWRRCKLAWISLSSFAWPYVALLIYALWTGIGSLFKR